MAELPDLQFESILFCAFLPLPILFIGKKLFYNLYIHRHLPEKKGRNVRETFTRFSDNAMRMKKDGVEKAEHSWTGMRRRVRRLKLVRALRRRSDAEEEGEDGRIYLKDGKGKAMKKLYTFRKSSS